MSIHYETALTIATKIRTGETSSVEVTETMLGRIAEVDPTLKAFVTISEEAALAAAADVANRNAAEITKPYLPSDSGCNERDGAKAVPLIFSLWSSSTGLCVRTEWYNA